MIFTYTIYDSNPNSCGCEWPSHDGLEIEADDADEATYEVRDALESAARGLSTSDGYAMGQTLYAQITGPDETIVAVLTHDLTAEDLDLSDCDIEWGDPEDSYVQCCYGRDGTDPGDCYTRVGSTPAGSWWFDAGDAVEREEFGPYPTEEAATAAASEYASANDEAEAGEDADDMVTRLLEERAGEPDPDGEWCVYWETSLDDEYVVRRYTSCEAATAAAELLAADLAHRHSGRLLCGYGVRVLRDGEWVRSDEEES